MQLLTQTRPQTMELEVKLEGGQWRHVVFSRFFVGSAATNYTLSVSGFQNNSGLCSKIFDDHDGRPFITGGRCRTLIYPFGWWFGSNCNGNAINGEYGRKNHYGGFILVCREGSTFNLIRSTLKIQNISNYAK